MDVDVLIDPLIIVLEVKFNLASCSLKYTIIATVLIIAPVVRAATVPLLRSFKGHWIPKRMQDHSLDVPVPTRDNSHRPSIYTIASHRSPKPILGSVVEIVGWICPKDRCRPVIIRQRNTWQRRQL